MPKKDKEKKDSSLIKLESKKDIEGFLEKPTNAIAEFLTGLLAPEGSLPAPYILSAGRLVQATIKGKLFKQLGKEIDKYRKEGRIKEDYFATNKNQASLLELLQFIDSEIPDEEIFKAMKSIFFTGVSVDADKKQEEVAYQFLLLGKKLNSMDILILKACYEIYLGENLENVNTGSRNFGDWINTVSERIGYDLPELVSASDPKLVELGLLSGRTYSDQSGIRPGKEFRLTKLGIKFCEFITKWE